MAEAAIQSPAKFLPFHPMESKQQQSDNFTRNEKGKDMRHQNIVAAKAIADAVRTSLGPRGMDKMICDAKNEVIITNDGATILKEMQVMQPVAKMLVELSKGQDAEAGDGTTSVVVIAGAILQGAQTLLDRGLHPQIIAGAFMKCAYKCDEILTEMAHRIEVGDRNALIEAAITSLNSKVVSQVSTQLAAIAVDAVLKLAEDIGEFTKNASFIDIKDIRVVKRLGGVVEDTELVNGLILNQQKASRVSGGPTFIKNAKIGLIQFCLSPPKTDIENNITVKNYESIDRLLKEERLIIAKQIKKIAATGCNVLLIQKSILRDATTDISLDYLAKAKIMVITDIERDEVEFICKTLQCDPIASTDHFVESALGRADEVAEVKDGSGGRLIKIQGTPGKGTATILCRASNQLILDEAERSLHDALCVVRCLLRKGYLLPGGGAAEMELSSKISLWARSLTDGAFALCAKSFAEALEVIPYTLAENGGLTPIEVVTELRNRHISGETDAGINIKDGVITNVTKDAIVQPLLVSSSAIKLATETVMMILKIDDLVMTRT